MLVTFVLSSFWSQNTYSNIQCPRILRATFKVPATYSNIESPSNLQQHPKTQQLTATFRVPATYSNIQSSATYSNIQSPINIQQHSESQQLTATFKVPPTNSNIQSPLSLHAIPKSNPLTFWRSIPVHLYVGGCNSFKNSLCLYSSSLHSGLSNKLSNTRPLHSTALFTDIYSLLYLQ